MRIVHNHKVLGVVFIALVLTAVWFTYAGFTKKFTDYEKVANRDIPVVILEPTT